MLSGKKKKKKKKKKNTRENNGKRVECGAHNSPVPKLNVNLTILSLMSSLEMLSLIIHIGTYILVRASCVRHTLLVYHCFHACSSFFFLLSSSFFRSPFSAASYKKIK